MAAADPYRPPTTNVWAPATEDAPASSKTLASRVARLGAVAVDGLLYFAAALPVLLGGGFAMLMRMKSEDAPRPDDVGMAMLPWVAISGVLWIGLLIYQLRGLSRSGQTVGKRVAKVRIVRTDGSRAGLGRIFWLRMAAMGVLGVIPIAGIFISLLDPLMIFGASRRCLHDLLADTIVVEA